MKKILLLTLLMGLNVYSEDLKESSSEKSWSYENEDEWEVKSGEFQSPIDISTNKTIEDSSYDELDLNYKEAKILNVEDNHHTIKVSVENAKSELNDRDFDLLQFHFHAKSEHTLNNEYFPMEIHFVNKASDGKLGVVGVFVKEGKENKTFDSIMNKLTGENSYGEIHLDDLLPDNKSYYHYLGSLTTPPLTENVEWYVLNNPIELSKSQIDKFNKYYSDNNRDVQNLNDRSIIKHID